MDRREIISYQDHYTDIYEHSSINGKSKIDRQANDIVRFFSDEQYCPFCKFELITTFMGTRRGTMGHELYIEGDVQECPHCGWWTLKTHFADEADEFDVSQGHRIFTDTKHYGIAHTFSVNDEDLPIQVLNAELINRPELVYSITPRKLEELAQDILRGVYDCEVEHVGKRGDGGKDLIVLNSDSPILVQVKQRQSRDHVELVSVIREFVGTMYIEGARKGIFLSTAKRFSKGSIETAQQLLDSRKLDYFEFINYDKLRSLIQSRNIDRPWKPLVQEFYSDKHAHVYDTVEEIQNYQAELLKLKKELFGK